MALTPKQKRSLPKALQEAILKRQKKKRGSKRKGSKRG